MSLTFVDENRAWLDLLVHEVLLFIATHVFALEKVKVIACEEVKLVLHLPDLRLLNLRLCDGQRICLSFCFAQMRLV